MKLPERRSGFGCRMDSVMNERENKTIMSPLCGFEKSDSEQREFLPYCRRYAAFIFMIVILTFSTIFPPLCGSYWNFGLIDFEPQCGDNMVDRGYQILLVLQPHSGGIMVYTTLF